MTNKPDERAASRLISELLADPEKFTQLGAANTLLKQFLLGHPVDYLGPLLRQKNPLITRNAIWIVSELGAVAAPLLADAARLSNHPDRTVRHFALDVITLVTVDARQEKFAYVVKRLEDIDRAVARNAVKLVAHATDKQLTAAKGAIARDQPASPHLLGLSIVLKAKVNPENVESAIKGTDALRRRYGLAGAERAYDNFPHLLKLAGQSDDEFLKQSAMALEKIHAVTFAP